MVAGQLTVFAIGAFTPIAYLWYNVIGAGGDDRSRVGYNSS